MVFIGTADDVYARSVGGAERQRHEAIVTTTGTKVGPGGNTQGTPVTCKGPACNAKPPKGPSTNCGIVKLTGGFGVLYERQCF